MRLRGLVPGFLPVALCLSGLTAVEPEGEQLRPSRTSLISHWFDLPLCNDTLSLELPVRYRVMHWRRMDFDEFSITETGQSRSGAELTVYIGHAPNERHPHWSGRTEARIAGHRVYWYSWSDRSDGKTVYWAEAIVGFFPVRTNDPPRSPAKPPAPSPGPPPQSPEVCREGVSVQLLAHGLSPEAAQVAAALASSLKGQ